MKKIFLYIVGFFGAVIIAWVTITINQPTPISFNDIALNENAEQFISLTGQSDHSLVIPVSSGNPDSVMGFIGSVIVQKEKDDNKNKWSLIGNFRPPQTELLAKPLKETLYKGVVTNSFQTNGDFTAVTSKLSIDEAAEIQIENELFVSYKDNSKIPWKELKKIPLISGEKYLFVDSAIITNITYKKYRKTSSDNTISGVAFSANGNIYASTEGFSSNKYASLRVFDIRLMRPHEGAATDINVGELLIKESLSKSEANKLVTGLQGNTTDIDAAGLSFDILKKN